MGDPSLGLGNVWITDTVAVYADTSFKIPAVLHEAVERADIVCFVVDTESELKSASLYRDLYMKYETKVRVVQTKTDQGATLQLFPAAARVSVHSMDVDELRNMCRLKKEGLAMLKR